MASAFEGLIGKPTGCAVTDAKLLLLCEGIDLDFVSIAKDFPDLKEQYKTSRSVISFRHLGVPTAYRHLMIDELILSEGQNSSVVKTYISPTATLILVSRDRELQLRRKDTATDLPVSVNLVELDEFSRADPGFPEKNVFLNRIGIDRIGLLPFEGCELWLDGRQCSFCGAVPKRIEEGGLPNILEAHRKYGGDYRLWWDSHRRRAIDNIQRSFAYLCQNPPSPHFHFMLMSENLRDYDFMYEIALEISSTLNSIHPLGDCDSYFNCMPPVSEDYLFKVKDAGYRSFMTNLEFIRREDFEEFCPGKQAAYKDGYGHMMSMMRNAVGVFGPGNVRTNFVLTSQQISHLKRDLPKLAESGIVPDVSIFFPRRVSRWRGKRSPGIDEVLEFSLFLARIYNRHGFRPYCCSLSSRSSILNELVRCA